MKSEDWISVEDGLPEFNKDISNEFVMYSDKVVVHCHGGYFYFCTYQKYEDEMNAYWIEADGCPISHVTHWQYITPPNAL